MLSPLHRLEDVSETERCSCLWGWKILQRLQMGQHQVGAIVEHKLFLLGKRGTWTGRLIVLLEWVLTDIEQPRNLKLARGAVVTIACEEMYFPLVDT